MMDDLKTGRYVLYLDILGFKDLIESKEADEIYHLLNAAVAPFVRWNTLNGDFRTIHFSDTFIFYQDPPGYGEWAFLDVYAIGAMLLSALLAQGIPARGCITFGEFNARMNESGDHQLFYGPALIEAYMAESKENWIGISILPNAWKPWAESSGALKAFTSEGVWHHRDDDVLLLNPFVKARSWYHQDQIVGEITRPITEWDAPEFPNEIKAFKFLREKSEEFSERNDFTSNLSQKYHSTYAFLKSVMGEECFKWMNEIADESTLPDT